MTVEIKQVTQWSRALDAARMTVGKPRLDKEPSDAFKRKMLLAEHSPIRLVEFDITLRRVPYFVAMHLTRHKHGVEFFCSTSRSDRTGVDRRERKQTDLVDMQMSLNAQALMTISRKRLCACADAETQKVWRMVIKALDGVDPILASKCVAECQYRGFCPEDDSCGFAGTDWFQECLQVYREK